MAIGGGSARGAQGSVPAPGVRTANVGRHWPQRFPATVPPLIIETLILDWFHQQNPPPMSHQCRGTGSQEDPMGTQTPHPPPHLPHGQDEDK